MPHFLDLRLQKLWRPLPMLREKIRESESLILHSSKKFVLPLAVIPKHEARNFLAIKINIMCKERSIVCDNWATSGMDIRIQLKGACHPKLKIWKACPQIG